MSPIEEDIGAGSTWFGALSGKQMNGLMNAAPSENELSYYGNNADVMVTIARIDYKGLLT